MEQDAMSNTAPAGTPRPWWRGWSDFWFKPSDPTTLGFIRVCTGLLVLYIHLAYSFDLQAFFGPHGWYASELVERERRELPSFVSSFTDWDEQLTSARLSDYPHRRAAFMEFLKATYLADPQTGERPDAAAATAYLKRINTDKRISTDPATYRLALEYVKYMKTRDILDKYLTALAGGKIEQRGEDGKVVNIAPTYAPPQFFADLPIEEKPRLASEVRAFWNALNGVRWGDPVNGRDYVFDHLIDAPLGARHALVKYMTDSDEEGTSSLLKQDEEGRKRLLDYLEYWNYDPRVAYRKGSAIFSVWFHVTDPTQMALVHTGVLILIVLFTIGLFTRVTSVLVWLAVISYIHRTQQVLFGMDTMMNILLFYLMIGNSGAALSVDRLIARYRAAKASLRRSGTLDANTRAFLACPPPSVGAGFAMRLIQIHFCFIYAAAGLAKLKGNMWWDGSAFWEVVVNPEFTLMLYPWYEESLRAIANVKPLYFFMISTAVWFTIFVEIGLPFLVWTNLRWLIIFLAVLMHAIIAVLMGLNLFELLMIVMMLAFLPDRVIRDRFRGGPDLSRFAFRFNPSNATHTKAVALAVALDVDNQVTPTADSRAEATTVAVAGGTPVTGAAGAGLLFKGLRLFSALKLLLWIPGVKGLLARRLFPTAAEPKAAPSVKPPAPAAR
jgi:hypothetical protein